MKKRIHKESLSEDSSQRSVIRGMIQQLFQHGALKTTASRARLLKSAIDTLIVKAKKEDVSTARLIAQKTGNFTVAQSIMQYAVEALKKRNSGFVSVKKIGMRRGDGALLVNVALLDFVSKQKTKKSEDKKESTTPLSRSQKKLTTVTKDKK